MKKTSLLLSFIFFIFSLNGCSSNSTITEEREVIENESNNFTFSCEKCDITLDLIEDDIVETSDRGHICITCAFRYNYLKCQNCSLYYDFDAGYNTLRYCENCVDENTNQCCFCETWPLEYSELVNISSKDKSLFACTDCCSDYFSNSRERNNIYKYFNKEKPKLH